MAATVATPSATAPTRQSSVTPSSRGNGVGAAGLGLKRAQPRIRQAIARPARHRARSGRFRRAAFRRCACARPPAQCARAISRRRETPRASSRLATLTQAMSRTRPTAPKQQQQRGTDLAGDLAMDRHDSGAPAGVGRGIGRCEVGGNLRHLALGLRERHAAPQSSDGDEVSSARAFAPARQSPWASTGPRWGPAPRSRLASRPRPSGAAPPICTRRPTRPASPPKRRLPQPVADEGDVIARAIFFGRERPSDRRVDAEDLEQPSRHKLHRHFFGRAGLAEGALET